MKKRIFNLIIFILFFISIYAQSDIGQKMDNDKIQFTSSEKPKQSDSTIKVSKQINSYILPFLEYFDNRTFPPTDWISFRGVNGAGINYDWDISVN
mgnify:CR=1 FL=1